MPPKRGIVKSGNAGNSSKASKPQDAAPATTIVEEKPLFPPGSKYPLSLLHERCQKNGWEKPQVDTRKERNGFSFVVTLKRMSKKTSQQESVRLEPHPSKILPTALEARHWGATYALYRFCNGIQLNRVLPPGPREYWNELAAEHQDAPEHQKWMYDADPFAARKAVEERQAKAAAKRAESSQEGQGTRGSTGASREFENAPEARMASALRDLVEDSIKKGIALYPDADNVKPAVINPEDGPQVQQQLCSLGFKPSQARSAVEALSRPSLLASNLLHCLAPLQACIEYLILQVPECDLPQRFLPSANTSESFVTSTHAGTDDLKKRWVEEKAVKECGWPAHVVKECMSDVTLAGDWAMLVSSLDQRLLGQKWLDSMDAYSHDEQEVDQDELDALGGECADNNEIVIPLPVAPLKLVVLTTQNRTVPINGVPPPLYITSPSVPAYIRLHLVSKLLSAFISGTLLEFGETFIMAAVRVLEEEWVNIEDRGPPDISAVLAHLIPSPSGTEVAEEVPYHDATFIDYGTRRKQGGPQRRDDRSDSAVKEAFLNMQSNDQYTQILAARRRLPAYSAHVQFVDLLEHNRCVVVIGETGCGKTTQLPQFVLDSMILAGNGSRASIIVTQPRRLSALGVAARVSAERLDDGSVGYAIRGESKQSKRTKLLFCTTGVVLRRLGSGDRLSDVTHIIVDEVHERSVDGDFLLLELKELLKTHPRLKVVLMSATINHEIFVKYFNNARLLTIPGFTYPVEDKYLEDYISELEYSPSGSSGRARKGKEAEEESKALRQELSKSGLNEDTLRAVQSISRSDRIDFDLISAIVSRIVSTTKKRGATLIFLPGVQEIRQCMEKLRNIPNTRMLPLHANLSNDEQRLVFQSFSEWKIVVATNTSITIDDVIYVIDSGKVKETHYDSEIGLTKLTEQWITRAAARQRRGRAGRTQPGICYKLYTRMEEKKMMAFPVPEIKRVPLESVALTVKVVHEDIKTFLSRAIDPPETQAVDKALTVLEELAAIDANGELTPLGRHMAMLPVDLRLGKMLILSTIFHCLGPILTIAACLSSKPLFVSPIDKRDEATRARARFAKGSSDLLTDMNAYDECTRLHSEGKSQGAIRAFCEENYISPSTIRDITSLRQDFLASLSELGFVSGYSKPNDDLLNVHSANTNLLKAVILGGLWPRVARVSLPRSAIKFDRVQAGTVQRENTAKEYKLYDLKDGRVFLHPASVLFNETVWRSPFVTYFLKQATSKVFLRDATEVPVYALLLFGGPVLVNHIGGGLTVGTKDAIIKLKAWPRIGVLVNQLRRLLDAQLKRCIEDGATLNAGQHNPVLRAMLALLENDGLSS
ncbi:P-loop containing nucleoside triphosphate hydrolase protein [Laetiporus sulphureus 93-53]|uniref:p-loop containing nucleoside triphosphate hydrolase protein n=1 Tax=Laetiporus sulphureus 93-53 TaxID=1314785 RepID=A0A165FC74_9APHY|nr:P-loop containing nucleoside triphosphate hydrolase protein [Laetiporus sulphureus 93-53]KZT08749.1 P-loop containing nucleoside triphosphate hydrolase protein [Laetiporus sulphureus 93-53]